MFGIDRNVEYGGFGVISCFIFCLVGLFLGLV